LRARGQAGNPAKQGSIFFEKKKQKTFALLVNAADASSMCAKRIKVFWFFFSKMNYFLSWRLPSFGGDSRG